MKNAIRLPESSAFKNTCARIKPLLKIDEHETVMDFIYNTLTADISDAIVLEFSHLNKHQKELLRYMVDNILHDIAADRRIAHAALADRGHVVRHRLSEHGLSVMVKGFEPFLQHATACIAEAVLSFEDTRVSKKDLTPGMPV